MNDYTEVKAYRCSYCSRLTTTEEQMNNHTKVCTKNPSKLTPADCKYSVVLHTASHDGVEVPIAWYCSRDKRKSRCLPNYLNKCLERI